MKTVSPFINCSPFEHMRSDQLKGLGFRDRSVPPQRHHKILDLVDLNVVAGQLSYDMSDSVSCRLDILHAMTLGHLTDEFSHAVRWDGGCLP